MTFEQMGFEQAVRYVQNVGLLIDVLMLSVPFAAAIAIRVGKKNRPGSYLIFPRLVFWGWLVLFALAVGYFFTGAWYSENGPPPQVAAAQVTSELLAVFIVVVAVDTGLYFASRPRLPIAPANRPGIRAVVGTLLVAAVLLLGFMLRLTSRMHGGSGVVLDPSTNQPVAGATVELDCRRYSRSGDGQQFMRVETDEAGRYRFGDRDVSGCDYGFVRVSKEGFMDPAPLAFRYEHANTGYIPKVRYLTPAGDIAMIRLRTLDPGSRLVIYPPGKLPAPGDRTPPNEPPGQEYDRVFTAFYASKWIANTSAEKDHVLTRYCGRLADLYAAMSDAEKEQVGSHIVSFVDVLTQPQDFHMAARDYQTEVQPYCNSVGAVRSPYEYRYHSSTSCLLDLQAPTRFKNDHCAKPIHVTLAFNNAVIEEADLSPGQEYAPKHQGIPRTAECSAGEIAVTSAGTNWTGIGVWLCRGPASSQAGGLKPQADAQATIEVQKGSVLSIGGIQIQAPTSPAIQGQQLNLPDRVNNAGIAESGKYFSWESGQQGALTLHIRANPGSVTPPPAPHSGWANVVADPSVFKPGSLVTARNKRTNALTALAFRADGTAYATLAVYEGDVLNVSVVQIVAAQQGAISGQMVAPVPAPHRH